MKQDFLNYIKKEFDFSDEEMTQFEKACIMPLKKSIRVNTNKISIEDFKKTALKNNWQLTETSLGSNTFYIDRFDDLDTALGNTQEHQKGYFYVQELAASSSPYYMSGDKVDHSQYVILDMSASPGGKTTQLSEYYPDSIIVANEINKERFKGLFFNLDRMGVLNVVCTNYDGRFFKETPELFDKVLLDAPCSGEGTAYKTDDSLKYRNIKNIKSISKLQLSLIDSAVKTLKVGGELVYSTCTLNKLENEGVVEAILERYKDSLEIIPDYIRSWPHITHTGGFFVAKIKKIKSIVEQEKKAIYSRNSMFDVKMEKKNRFSQVNKDVVQNYEKLSSKDTKIIEKYIDDNYNFQIQSKKFYRYKDDIFITDMDISDLRKKLFMYKIGVNIGKYKNNEFVPSDYLESLR
ncbi:NOL1/NOP2/sun family putative RNA methylase [Candidatus Gracilibacteria bacterium]|nr:NOL1/NOP2/sun family putative RNA methylase [Candidatus Gracilibacteria bacterium]